MLRNHSHTKWKRYVSLVSACCLSPSLASDFLLLSISVGEKSYLCDLCGFAGGTRHALTKHRRQHTGNQQHSHPELMLQANATSCCMCRPSVSWPVIDTWGSEQPQYLLFTVLATVCCVSLTHTGIAVWHAAVSDRHVYQYGWLNLRFLISVIISPCHSVA